MQVRAITAPESCMSGREKIQAGSLWRVDVHKVAASLLVNAWKGFVPCTGESPLCGGCFNWRFKQFSCFLNALVVAKIQPLRSCKPCTSNIVYWQIGLSSLTAQERGRLQGAYCYTDEKLLLQPAELAVLAPVVGVNGILVSSGYWMWPKEDAKGRTWRV